MNVEYARRGLIGALTPQANTTVEPEFRYLWPPGYAMINARMMSPKKTIEERLVDYWSKVEGELKQFANAPVEAIAFGCTGTSYLVGKDAEDEVVDRIYKNHTLPFITSAKAVVEALDALNAKTIGLVSCYPPSLTEKSILYWESRGFRIGEVTGQFNDASDFHPIYSLSANTADEALQLLRGKKLDAIVMLGTGMPTLLPIADAAGWDGAPVMSCMLCLAWRTILAVDGVEPSAENVMHWVNGAHWAPRLRADLSEIAGSMSSANDLAHTALLLLDLQNDFLHPDGAYGRAGQVADAVAAVPVRLAPLVARAREEGLPILSSHFTLVPGPGGEPLIAPHLKQLRPFLARGDFAPGGWGHQLVDALAPSDYQVEKIAYSAFYMTRLEWLLRKLDVRHIIAAGIVTNGGVASTVRDAHVRDFSVTLAQDGCAAFSSDVHDTAVVALRPVAQIATIGDIMAQLKKLRDNGRQAPRTDRCGSSFSVAPSLQGERKTPGKH